MITRFSRLTALMLVGILAISLLVTPVQAAPVPVVVDPSDIGTDWFVSNDGVAGVSSGAFVTGPATPPMGVGSMRFTLDENARYLIGTPNYAGTRLDALSALSFVAYQPKWGLTLQFDIDYNGIDADTSYQGRLSFEPSETGVALLANSWQTWDALAVTPNGAWWASRAPGNTVCPQSNPCNLSELLAAYPNAVIHANYGYPGFLLIKAGGPIAAGFTGYADALTVSVTGVSETVYDFEPPTVTYVDDDFTSTTPGWGLDHFAKIQDGIDYVQSGGTVNVFPGSYSETAANRTVLDLGGVYQFGLFFDADKPGITVQGVDASGAPITGYADVVASVTTNATNNFGPSGVFVEGDNVTLSGVRILPNVGGDNKTIEVIGNNFSLEASVIDVPGGGSVYLNDWRFDEDTDESYLQSYSILNNLFAQAATLDITSGAGYTGPVAGRLIQGNRFEYTPDAYWPAISFSGNSVVPWFTDPVNGATITGNSFVGTTQHIRARGGYDNTTFDWLAYRANNTFDKTVLAFVGDTDVVRSFEYETSYGTMDNVRRLTASIQFGVDDAIAGDTVDVSAGTFTEQVVISKNILLQGADGASIIQAYNDMPTCFTTSEPAKPVVCVKDTNDANITGFTIDGLGLGNKNYRFSGIAFHNAGGTVQDNTIRDIRDTPFSGNQHGVGIYAYNDDAVARTLHILDNTVTGFQKTGIAANASDTNRLTVDIQRNTVTGQGPTTVTAQNGIQVWANAGEGVVADNIISGIAYDNTLNPTKWVATSILNYYADLDTTGNTITGAHMGIYYWEGRGLIENNDLTIEKVGVYAYGINAADPPQAVPSPFDAPVSTQANTQLAPNGAGINVAVLVIPVEISHNTINFSGTDKTATYGIEADAGYENNDLDVDIHHNTVNGFEYGLTFYQCTAECGLGAFESISAVSNNLTDNTVGIYFGGAIPTDVVPVLHHNRIFGDVTTDTGLVNDLTVGIKAENNWWGCNAGPADAACVGITGLVDADPWLVLTFTADQTTLVSGSVIHLTANLSRNSTGLDTTALGSVMDGFVIEFDTTYGTLDPLSAGMVNASTATALTVPNPITINTATVSAEFDNQVVEIVFNGWIYIWLPLIFR